MLDITETTSIHFSSLGHGENGTFRPFYSWAVTSCKQADMNASDLQQFQTEAVINCRSFHLYCGN